MDRSSADPSAGFHTIHRSLCHPDRKRTSFGDVLQKNSRNRFRKNQIYPIHPRERVPLARTLGVPWLRSHVRRTPGLFQWRARWIRTRLEVGQCHSMNDPELGLRSSASFACLADTDPVSLHFRGLREPSQPDSPGRALASEPCGCNSRYWGSPSTSTNAPFFRLAALVAIENRESAVPFVVERATASLPRNPSPFLLGRPGAKVLLPRARDALLGETFRENRKSRVPPTQSFYLKPSPIRKGLITGDGPGGRTQPDWSSIVATNRSREGRGLQRTRCGNLTVT